MHPLSRLQTTWASDEEAVDFENALCTGIQATAALWMAQFLKYPHRHISSLTSPLFWARFRAMSISHFIGRVKGISRVTLPAQGWCSWNEEIGSASSLPCCMHLDTEAPKREQAPQLAGDPAKPRLGSHTPLSPESPPFLGPSTWLQHSLPKPGARLERNHIFCTWETARAWWYHTSWGWELIQSLSRCWFYTTESAVHESGWITVLSIELSTPLGAASLAASGELHLGSQGSSCDANHHPLIGFVVNFVPSIAWGSQVHLSPIVRLFFFFFPFS